MREKFIAERRWYRVPFLDALIIISLLLAIRSIIAILEHLDLPTVPKSSLGELFDFCMLIISIAAIGLAAKSFRKQRSLPRENPYLECSRFLKAQVAALNSHAIVSITSSEGNIIYANNKFLDTFGYSKNEIEGKHYSIVCPNGPGNDVRNDLAAKACVSSLWEGRKKFIKKTGEDLLAFSTVFPILDSKGKRTHNVCVQSDITALDADNSQRAMALFLDELQDEVYVYEASSLSMVYANKSACQRCNWNLHNIREKRITDSSENFVESAFCDHVAPLLSGKRNIVSIEAVHENGPVEILTRLIETPTGDQMFLSVLRDIAWRQKLLQAKMESVSEISHELRTPLTSIMGSLRLLESGIAESNPDVANRIMSVASRNTERLLAIVNDILDFQKLETGNLTCEKTPLELSALIDESISENIMLFSEYDLNLDFFAQCNCAFVNGDRQRLLQVMSNLISNAAKYSPKGGVIRIKLTEVGTFWRISVEDDGPGIPPEHRDKIFKSFGRVASPDGIKRKGTGLGLSICKKIVDIHKGRIDFSSTVGSGSEFFIDLPKIDVSGSADASDLVRNEVAA